MNDHDLGIDAEQHPDTGRWRWLYCSPGAAECLGLFKHDTEAAARREGRAFARRAIKANAEARRRRR